MTIVRPGTPRTRFRTSRRYLGPLFFDKKSISITVPISVPILNRFCADLRCSLDPKILQNDVRGVRNLTLRIYTFDVDPMCFWTDFRHPNSPQSGSKTVPRRCADDNPSRAGTQNDRELFALPRLEPQSSRQPTSSGPFWVPAVDVSFGIPVLVEPGVHCRFGIQSFVRELEPKTAVNSLLFQDRNPNAHANPTFNFDFIL